MEETETNNGMYTFITVKEAKYWVTVNIYLSVIEYINAFGKVKRYKLINMLEDIKTDEKDLRVMQMFY